MRKKTSPEFFELIKNKDFKIKTADQKPETEIKVEPVVKVKEPEYKPVQSTQNTTRAAYPKLKTSFVRKTGGQTPGDRIFTMKYNTAIFLVILVVIAIFLAFMWSHWNDLTKQPSNSGNVLRGTPKQSPSPAPKDKEPSPVASSTYYTIQLRSFKTDRPNEIAAGQIVTKLKNAGIDAEKKKGMINGISLWVIYAGRFSSENEARSAVNNYKKLYHDFDKDFRNYKVEKKTK
ncbi:MAG: SPOR domain-containing protein [Planctomycetota bacterium]